MAPTTVSQYITITNSKGSTSYAKGRELKLDGKDNGVSKENIDLFKILRAGDGDETTLSLEDFQKLSKEDAVLKSFGYEIIKNDKHSYTVKGEQGTFNFKFESFLEACGRKLQEYNNKYEAKRIEGLKDKYEISELNDSYQVTIQNPETIYQVARDFGVDPLAIAKANRDNAALANYETLGSTISHCENTEGASETCWKSFEFPEGAYIIVPKNK